MKIITYSDLHLEFCSGWLPPADVEGDLIILAGDIISLKNYDPLDRLLKGWDKPVLYVTGNHEYYTQTPMNEENDNFKIWLEGNHPNVTLLQDEEVIRLNHQPLTSNPIEMMCANMMKSQSSR